jgi:hypothetical protein
MKEAISSQNMTRPIRFSTYDIIYKYPLLSYTFKNEQEINESTRWIKI